MVGQALDMAATKWDIKSIRTRVHELCDSARASDWRLETTPFALTAFRGWMETVREAWVSSAHASSKEHWDISRLL